METSSLSSSEEGVTTNPLEDPSANFSEALAQHDELDWAIRQLPERERYIIEQHFWHDRAFKDIAKDLGLAKSTVSYIVNKHALPTLREILESNGHAGYL